MEMSKKTIKTQEELLKEALVPIEDQPFDLPANWIWVRLNSCLEKMEYGYTASSTLEKVGPRYLRITDIQDNNVDWYNVPHCEISDKDIKKYQLASDDIVVARTGATTGKSYLIKGPPLSVFASYLIRLRTKSIILPEYLWIFMKSSIYWNQITVVKKGSAQPGANAQILGGLSLPLPPLNEQKRIADKIERLLGKINQAKQLIEEAKATFELRRAAILDKAFRGELTKKWREAKGIDASAECFFNDLKQKIKSTKAKIIDLPIPYELPSGWKWVRIKDIAMSKSGYAFKSGHFSEDGIQLVRMGNLYKNKLDLNRNPVFLPIDYEKSLLEKFSVKTGDILLSLTGTKYKRDYGFAVRINEQENMLLLNQRILSLTPLELNDYFYYYLQSPAFRDTFFKFETGAVNQGNVSSVAVENIWFPLPPYEEGLEIQKLIQNLLSSESNIEDMINIKLEMLEQSILSKAFRGELGTNNNEDEMVIE